MLDKKRFPDIICANESDASNRPTSPYYTNSTQLPVDFTDDMFETLRLQDELQSKYTGGTVLHVFLGEQVEDTAVIKALVRKIAANYRLPYFTLTPTFSICPTHGYLDGEQPCCPLQRGNRGLLPRGRLPAAGGAVEQRQAGGVWGPEKP